MAFCVGRWVAAIRVTATARPSRAMAPVLQDSFVRYGTDLNGGRFPHPMTVTVRGHVLMDADANDAYGLTVIGLGKHATAASLGPIRFLVESLAWLSWLLEDPDDMVRRARAYRLAERHRRLR